MKRKSIFWASIGAIFLMSLWLRQTFPIFAIGPAGYDDLLFIKLAAYLGAGQWLGPYNNLTMAKGGAYSLFLVANHFIGLPLKITEQIVYLSVSLYFSLNVGRLFRSGLAVLVCFLLLAFNPIFWNSGVAGRLVREGLYGSLSLLLFALAIQIFLLDRSRVLGADIRAKLPVLAGFGVTAGVYWLTREEGVWLLPTLMVLVIYWMVRRWPRYGTDGFAAVIGQLVIFLTLPAAAFFLVVGAVDAVNYVKYGVFRNNDFRSADFQAAYGALSRIRHEHWQPYVVFPKDARVKAYAVSPHARELKPYFEGPGGEGWRKVGCDQTATSPCPEILSGWFMWALRDAVAASGHYSSASAAMSYYRWLASEVNEACDRGTIQCGPRRDSMIPPWHSQYAVDTLEASKRVYLRLITLDWAPVVIEPSFGTEEQLGLFSLVTNGPLVLADQVCGANSRDVEKVGGKVHFCSPRDRIRLAMSKWIAHLQVLWNVVAIPAAMLAWVALLAFSVVRGHWHSGHVLVAALMAAIVTRVGLLGFLDATSIPSNNMLYLSPVVPMALSLVPCVPWLGIALAKEARHEPEA